MNWKDIKAFFSSVSIQQLLPFLMIFVFGMILAKILIKLFDRALERSSLNRTIFSYLKTLIRIVVYTLVLLMSAGSLGIDVTSLIAVFSVVSLAVSLAVQSTLENVVGGVTLLATHPFRVGDFVQIGSDSGVIEELTMSYTKIKTSDGKRIYIPNRDAASARICNFTDMGKRRIEIVVSASYGDDSEKVRQALLAAGNHLKRLKDEPYEAYLNAYLDSGVEYILRLWVLQENYSEVRFAVLEAVKREFDARGISIPFPQMEVRVDKHE